MNAQISLSDPGITSQFYHSLLTQFLLIVLFTMFTATLYVGIRLFRGADIASTLKLTQAATAPIEPRVRRLLRISFGVLWLFDGVLQLQPAMPLGLPANVISPLSSGEPAWVGHLVTYAANLWEQHPIPAATSAVWIQIGLGLWLLLVPRGVWSRVGGVASAIWAINVWVLGEAFGGIFAPGATWFLGAPGAVLFYAVAGIALALPWRILEDPRIGRIAQRGIGVLLGLFAVLQAYPGRGYWQGKALTSMASAMSTTHQPAFVTSLLQSWHSLLLHDAAVANLFIVLGLGLPALSFITGRFTRAAVTLFVVFQIATWLVGQDLGFIGGVGTDPNAALPALLIGVAAYRLAQLEARSEAPLGVDVIDGSIGFAPSYPSASGLLRISRWIPVFLALGVTVFGSAPLAYSAVEKGTSTVLAQAIDGLPSASDTPAPGFTLVDQHGHLFTASDLKGKVTFLTFLDPVCTNDCPFIGQEVQLADQLLGSNASHVNFVAVATNPLYYSEKYVQAYDKQDNFQKYSNFRFLTGSLPALTKVWSQYGVSVQTLSQGEMVAHSEIAVIIDAKGNIRWLTGVDPGNRTQLVKQSFASLFDQYIHQTESLS